MNSSLNAPQNRKDVKTQRLPDTAERRRDVELRLVFEKKYECYIGLAYSMLRVTEEAEDVVAEVFHKALNEWEDQSYMGILNLEAYLTTCVQNACRNIIKRDKIKRSVINASIINQPSIYNPMAQFDLDIKLIMKVLSPEEAETLRLYMQGYTHKEIAAMLKCSDGTSRNRLSEARTKLRLLFGQKPDHDPDNDDSPDRQGKQSAASGKPSGFKKARKNPPGDGPRMIDLLNYLSTTAVSEQVRQSVLYWLETEDTAIDIVRGFRMALHQESAKDVAIKMKNSKDKLREQLFGPNDRTLKEDNMIQSPCFYLSSENKQIHHFYWNEIEVDHQFTWKYINNLKMHFNKCIVDLHSSDKKTHRNMSFNHIRLIAPEQKNSAVKMNAKKIIFNQFQDYIQNSYQTYCNQHGLSTTDDQFIAFLMDQNLISMTQLQRYTIQRAFEQLCSQYHLPKTRAVDTLSDRFMLSERTVWNMLKVKKEKKKGV